MPEVPTLPGLPLLGSALDLRRDLLGTYERARRTHGDVVRIVAGPMVLYNVFHPDAVQHVLAGNASAYRKDNQANADIAALFGNGLLTSQDETWRGQRRIVSPLFTRAHVASTVPQMAVEGEILAARWHGRTHVDVHEDMVTYAMRVVGRTLFGSDVEEAVAVCGEAFPVLGEYVRRRGMSPRPLPRTWPTPANRRAFRARAELVSVAASLLAKRHADPGAHDDLLSVLMKTSDLDDDQLRDQVLVFLLAGHETTACALTFSLYLLAQHPQWQEAVYDEVSSVLSGRAVDAEDLPKLELTTRVVRETMRLYPPAYFVGRLAPSGDSIGGYDIPAGATVLTSPWVTHRHPEFWDAPSRFDPSRFESGPDHRYAYFPFGGGPRACIGILFAVYESVIAVAALVQRYRIQPPATVPGLATGITLRPDGPVVCGVSAR